MCKNAVERGRPQMTVYGACALRAGYLRLQIHSGCVILIAFPQQQWLCEPASMVRYTYIAFTVVFMLVVHASVCGLLKILFLRIAFLALMYARKLNVMSVFKRPFHQHTDVVIFESRGDACHGFTARLDGVAVLTFVNSGCIVYVLLPAVLPSWRLSVTVMIRNMSVMIKFFFKLYFECMGYAYCLQSFSFWPVGMQ
jgi:hypothetical protein